MKEKQSVNDSSLLFYTIMRYPVPLHAEQFWYQKKNTNSSSGHTDFSREKTSHRMDEYLKQLKKIQYYFKHIPFINEVYVCNSMTFNMLTADSDIDIVIVTQNHRLRITRLCSLGVFWIAGLKRSLRNSTKKVCLSFTLEERATNLYPISLKHDIYLAYRVAHLVPIYQKTKKNTGGSLMKNNIKRVQSYLPNIRPEQMIFLGNKITYGRSQIRKQIEKILGFTQINRLIQFLRSPILVWKKRMLGKSGKDIIINDKMLKFHKCKRQAIQDTFEKSFPKGI